jgi:hypothetical protein
MGAQEAHQFTKATLVGDVTAAGLPASYTMPDAVPMLNTFTLPSS